MKLTETRYAVKIKLDDGTCLFAVRSGGEAMFTLRGRAEWFAGTLRNGLGLTPDRCKVVLVRIEEV